MPQAGGLITGSKAEVPARRLLAVSWVPNLRGGPLANSILEVDGEVMKQVGNWHTQGCQLTIAGALSFILLASEVGLT